MRCLGASESATAELLEYNENPFRQQIDSVEEQFPLADEPQVEAWRDYLEEAKQSGIFRTLQNKLVQLQFPIQKGISTSREYLDATRKGRVTARATDESGLELHQSAGLQLQLHSTPAGTIPILVTESRQDFVALVRAFSGRNEPQPVPESMGACIVKGLNNWDRIHTLRRRWEDSKGSAGSAASWQEEFRKIIPKKELYQDRFIILSRGPYSAVPADRVGLDEDSWLDRSLTIRRDHECTHYFTLRVLGTMRNNLLDELIADYIGLIGAFGRYRPELALLFLGLEGFPSVRSDGRLHNYRGDPPLSTEAFNVLKQLVVASIQNLARFDGAFAAEGRTAADLAATILVLASATLEDLAAEESADHLLSRARQRGG